MLILSRAQGQGISLLLRGYRETGDMAYLEAAQKAFLSFTKSTSEGGVIFTDSDGDLWIEEYIVSPPTHILNGFMWAVWGVYDYFLATGDTFARTLFEASVRTLLNNIARYDLEFWSLYEQSGTALPMVASPFYHQLHIVQLRVMHFLTGENQFLHYAERHAGALLQGRIQTLLLLRIREDTLRLAILSPGDGCSRGARFRIVEALGS